ncbi:MAG TPA: AzlD domain-containing protein [Burkholderiaceae bacterium]|nr:AzlD domain-containing protein [Burkholderiaceae bacterium]
MPADAFVAIVLMGLASYSCRAAGFLMMRWVAITPPVERWLGAIPMALMGAILGPAAIGGGPAQWAGLVIAMAVTRLTRSEFAGVMLAAAAVAAIRAAGR